MKDRKAVSVSEELYLAIRAIDGVRELAERLAESSFDTGPVPLSIASTLVIVRERLRMLDRAVRGTVDPMLLWCRETEPTESVDDNGNDGGDLLLQFWSDRKTIRRCAMTSRRPSDVCRGRRARDRSLSPL